MKKVIFLLTVAMWVLTYFAAKAQGGQSITNVTYNTTIFTVKSPQTVERYNAQKWTGGKVDSNLEQTFECDIATVTVLWQFGKVEIERDKIFVADLTQPAKFTDGGITQNVPLSNHGEIESFDIVLDKNHQFLKLVFHKN